MTTILDTGSRPYSGSSTTGSPLYGGSSPTPWLEVEALIKQAQQ